ncbi:MAG: chemotaxis protein CheZ [Parvibaculaceae bacterium]|jgi:chemotaxis protein CheZ|nr:protein phosphatase CheZ [Parvibaculaceae bacterium]
MSATRKRFRIETSRQGPAGPKVEVGSYKVDVAAEERAEERHREILDAIAGVSRKVGAVSLSNGDDGISSEMLDQYKNELKEAARMKHEMGLMHQAISRTRRELQSMQLQAQPSDHRINQATDELDEVVMHTERATETILNAAESIDNNAAALTGKLSGVDAAAAYDIQESVVTIFEACNFQDLTGQRINKVVNVLSYLDERLNTIWDIWENGSLPEADQLLEAANRMEAAANSIQAEVSSGDDVDESELLNGPGMEGDETRISQDEIDALFD